ncbi:hypothetical protein RFI_07175 [Reticulomyxa filosa]|uniref:Uncharacterized protein n=1 Tax=Reticulomyxa filosa TaxID=46433 RepID=X6NXF7_RETFI|nr:hypothetical protein RFI_07175 [Reticulomyxa filosa]|eukprot:ETO29947.1 hypothetical protein RFI_07175 [Reticulomyxa filosa]
MTRDSIIDWPLNQCVSSIQWNTKVHYDIPFQLQDLQDKANNCLEKGLLANHAWVGSIYNNLGSAYNTKGQHDVAITYHEQSLQIRIHIFGIHHVDVAASYHNLGTAYSRKGVYDKAIEYYEQSLQMKKQLFKGEKQTACKYYEEAWKIYNVVVGQFHYQALLAKKRIKELSQ